MLEVGEGVEERLALLVGLNGGVNGLLKPLLFCGVLVVDLRVAETLASGGVGGLHAHVIPKWERFPGSKEPEETLVDLLDAGVTTIRGLPLYSESTLSSAQVQPSISLG